MKTRDYYLIIKTPNGWKVEQRRESGGWLLVVCGIILMLIIAF